jgi:hypothetical protein
LGGIESEANEPRIARFFCVLSSGSLAAVYGRRLGLLRQEREKVVRVDFKIAPQLVLWPS